MTKLEEKLLELGYVYVGEFLNCKKYIKQFNNCVLIRIEITRRQPIGFVCFEGAIYFQEHINYIQQAFNQLQKDLEVLQNV